MTDPNEDAHQSAREKFAAAYLAGQIPETEESDDD